MTDFEQRALVAARFKRARVKVGLSQRGVARALDVSPTTVCDIEKAKRFPTVEFLSRAAALLGKRPEWFLSEREGLVTARPSTVILTEVTEILRAVLPVYESIDGGAIVGHIISTVALKAESLENFRAFVNDGMELEPTILKDDVIVVSANTVPEAGSTVIIRGGGQIAPAVCLVDDKGDTHYRTRNSLLSAEGVEVLGVVVEAIHRFI